MSFSLHVEVSLGKILKPKLLLMAAPLMCECVCECVNADSSFKSTLRSRKTRRALFKYSPFTEGKKVLPNFLSRDKTKWGAEGVTAPPALSV